MSIAKPRWQSGYVALMAVLIVGAASLAISTALLSAGTDSQRRALVVQQSVLARNMAAACAEDALETIHDNTSYTGTTNVTLGTNCSYTVTNLGGSSRRIDASGSAGNVVRRVQVHVTIGASSISVTSWQEVT